MLSVIQEKEGFEKTGRNKSQSTVFEIKGLNKNGVSDLKQTNLPPFFIQMADFQKY